MRARRREARSGGAGTAAPDGCGTARARASYTGRRAPRSATTASASWGLYATPARRTFTTHAPDDQLVPRARAGRVRPLLAARAGAGRAHRPGKPARRRGDGRGRARRDRLRGLALGDG